MSAKGGCYCVVRGCNTSTVGSNISMFRIPKDVERAKQWLKACNRLDLAKKSIQQLYNNHRVCVLHFRNNMFSDPYRKRLLPTAIPTEIVQYKETNQKPERKIVISDVQLAPSISKGIISPKTDSLSEPGPSGVHRGDTQKHNSELLDFQYSPLFVDVDSESTESGPASSMSTPSTTTSETFTQTNMSLSSGTRRKRKLRQSVKNLRSENVKVRRLIMNTSTTFDYTYIDSSPNGKIWKPIIVYNGMRV